jgi:hypothetical protein
MALQTFTVTDTTPVTYAENAVISFETNGEYNNPCPNSNMIVHPAGSQTINLNRPGLYLVQYNGTLANNTNAAGVVGAQIFVNGVAIPQAKGVETSSGAAEVVNVGINTYIRVLPSCAAIDNRTTITVVNVGLEANYYLNNLLVARVSN